MALGLIMLVQMLKRTGQSGQENLLGENLLPRHEGDLLCLEELDLQDDQILQFAVVQILQFAVD